MRCTVLATLTLAWCVLACGCGEEHRGAKHDPRVAESPSALPKAQTDDQGTEPKVPAPSASKEPPLNFGSGSPGSHARVMMLADLKLGETITYTIKYPSSGLESKTTYDFQSRAILKEVFPGKWYVEYMYDDPGRRRRKIPDAIRIMTCADNEMPGSLINEYRFVEATPRGLIYKDSSGGQKRVDHDYIAFPSGSR